MVGDLVGGWGGMDGGCDDWVGMVGVVGKMVG